MSFFRFTRIRPCATLALIACMAVLARGPACAAIYTASTTVTGPTFTYKTGEAADRHIADLIEIAKTKAVAEAARQHLIEDLHATDVGSMPDADRILETLRVRRVPNSHLISIEVRADEREWATVAASQVADSFMARYQELAQAADAGKPALRIVGPARAIPLRGVGLISALASSPLDLEGRVMVIAVIGVFAAVIGIAIGRLLGRRAGRKPQRPGSFLRYRGFALLLILGVLAWGATLLYAMHRPMPPDTSEAIIGDLRLVTRGPAAIPNGNVAQRIADIIGVAKSSAVKEQAVVILRRDLGIAHPEQGLSTLEVKQVDGSDLICISVKSRGETAARAAASVVAKEVIRQYRSQDHASQPVLQLLDARANLAPLPSFIVLRFWFVLGPPILLGLIAGAISHSLGRRSSHRP